MTTISKCLVVFTAAACVAFLAFVVVTTAGGPNWDAEANRVPRYYVERTTGENPQWVAKSRNDGQAVGQPTDSPAEAIVNARRKLGEEQQNEITQLDSEILKVRPRLEEARALIEVDVKAMEKREAELIAELAALRQQIQTASDEGIRKSQEAQAVQALATRRREDVYRLENQLAEIRTDKFRAQQQAEKLQDQIVRVGGNLERLNRRTKQLEKATYNR